MCNTFATLVTLSLATYPLLHIDDLMTCDHSESESLRLLDVPKTSAEHAARDSFPSICSLHFLILTYSHHSIYNRFGYVNSWGVSSPPAFKRFWLIFRQTDISSVLSTNPPTRLTTINHVRKPYPIKSLLF